jgi:hypothetical protein
MKLTTHFHLLPRTIMVELHLHSPIRLYGMVLNEAQGQLVGKASSDVTFAYYFHTAYEQILQNFDPGC